MVVKVKKPNPHDYSLWGVEKYGYKLWVNPPYLPINYEYIIDVENYRDGKFAGIGFLIPGKQSVYYFTKFPPTDYLKNKTLIGQVLRTDIHKLRKWGFDIDINKVHYDTALIEHLTDSTKKKYGLKELAKTKFGIEYPKYEQIVGEGDFDTVPLDVAANYNGMDLIATYELYKSQNHALATSDIYKDMAWPLGYVLNDMEERGIALDLVHLRRLETLLSVQSAEIRSNIQKELGEVNLNSPKQLLGALHAKGIFPTFKGKESTDKRGLLALNEVPIVSSLLQYSEFDTLLSSFVKPYLEAKTEVIRPFFSQTGTRTGRLACYRPNLQQIPTHTENGKRVKDSFVARPRCKLVELDYSAIEPRLLAHFSKSRNLCELFQSGVNFHDYTAKRLGIDRQAAKVLNLSTGYRATKYGLAYQLKCSVDEAERQLNDWWGLWPDLFLWEELLIAKTRKTGYVNTLLERSIHIDNLDSSDRKIKETAERRVIENTAQGSVSDLIGIAMIEAHKNKLPILNQVHDSLLFEFPENNIHEYIQKACNIMEHVIQLEVPVVVDVKVGNTWGSMEKYVA